MEFLSVGVPVKSSLSSMSLSETLLHIHQHNKKCLSLPDCRNSDGLHFYGDRSCFILHQILLTLRSATTQARWYWGMVLIVPKFFGVLVLHTTLVLLMYIFDLKKPCLYVVRKKINVYLSKLLLVRQNVGYREWFLYGLRNSSFSLFAVMKCVLRSLYEEKCHKVSSLHS